ncbi:aminotransferase class III-fold pyridoxal phosphate-dependent enzyme [Desulfoscipio gibsoniae]|uniref:aminotransferase class III-fold pyridoxal phosphate-dependent enzyme n=1 Tax=Desulfoscipio gibsoniae TaxID=102134 RepID=UPI000A045BD2|nr:aminotransferase class III-fold pyridoxal phosphate-dependent enzyme [Desulfoscipio gibsoniae]
MPSFEKIEVRLLLINLLTKMMFCLWQTRLSAVLAGQAAAAIANLDIVENENIPDQARVKGELLREKIRALDLPAIGEVRGIGMINGVQLVKNRETREKFEANAGFAKRVSYLGWENGLILRPLIDDGLQISPSVVITEKQFDELVAKLGASIDQAYQEYCSK